MIENNWININSNQLEQLIEQHNFYYSQKIFSYSCKNICFEVFGQNKYLLTDLGVYFEKANEKTNIDFKKLYKIYIIENNKIKLNNIYFDRGTCSIIAEVNLSFGIIKSLINGVLTYHLGLIPVHGALINIDNKNFIIYGSHNSGKTYMIDYILKKLNNVKISTDDWIGIKLHNNTINAIGIDKNISSIHFNSTNFINLDYDKSKKYYNLSCSDINFTEGKVTEFISLSDTYSPKINLKEYFLKSIINTAYHSPLSLNDITVYKNFWSKNYNLIAKIHVINPFSISDQDRLINIIQK